MNNSSKKNQYKKDSILCKKKTHKKLIQLGQNANYHTKAQCIVQTKRNQQPLSPSLNQHDGSTPAAWKLD